MAMLASKVFTTAKKLPPVGLKLMIMNLESNAYLAYLTELAWYVLVSLRFLYPF